MPELFPLPPEGALVRPQVSPNTIDPSKPAAMAQVDTTMSLGSVQCRDLGSESSSAATAPDNSLAGLASCWWEELVEGQSGGSSGGRWSPSSSSAASAAADNQDAD